MIYNIYIYMATIIPNNPARQYNSEQINLLTKLYFHG